MVYSINTKLGLFKRFLKVLPTTYLLKGKTLANLSLRVSFSYVLGDGSQYLVCYYCGGILCCDVNEEVGMENEHTTIKITLVLAELAASLFLLRS